MGESLAPSVDQILPDEKDKVVIRNGGEHIPRAGRGLGNFLGNSVDRLGLEDKARVAGTSESAGLGRNLVVATAPSASPKSSDRADASSGTLPEPGRTTAQRPNSLGTGTGFALYTPPAPPPTTTPLRRPASAYISSGISCMVPANSAAAALLRTGTLPRRPTSLYSDKPPKQLVPNVSAAPPIFQRGSSVPSTPRQPEPPAVAPRKSTPGANSHTWASSQQPTGRPTGFPGASIGPGNFHTWNSAAVAGNKPRRPHSIVGPSASLAPASPSDSGYRSLPSSASDYQVTSNLAAQQTEVSSKFQRRLSLPSAQAQLRPKPSPTFHGLPFRPFTCGVSPSGTPIFLGCTHLHPSPGGTNKPRVITPTTSQAIQQLLLHSRNGFRSPDDKIALFFEILDSQERFAKVIFFFFAFPKLPLFFQKYLLR